MDHVNFPSDISLILLSLRGDLFQEAIAITQLCAMFAHGFTATLVHFARLREIDGDNDVFIPYSKILYWPSLDIPVSLSDSDDKEAVDEEDVAEDNDDEGHLILEEEVVNDLERDLKAGESTVDDIAPKGGASKESTTDELEISSQCFLYCEVLSLHSYSSSKI